MFTTFKSFIDTCKAYALLDEEERLALEFVMEDDNLIEARVKGLNYSDLSALREFFEEVPYGIPDAAHMHRLLRKEQSLRRFGEDTP